jgi:hypothetical protein
MGWLGELERQTERVVTQKSISVPPKLSPWPQAWQSMLWRESMWVSLSLEELSQEHWLGFSELESQI